MKTRIIDWRPEDKNFWNEIGKPVAIRNLIISTYALLVAFSVWMLGGFIVAMLRFGGFNFTRTQELWLLALPALSAAVLRVFYTLAVPVSGGRNWTVITSVLLLLPALGIGIAVQNPQTPYWVFVILAILSGLGGASLASSIANINHFFPTSLKGFAIGLNAGPVNLMFSIMQFAPPFLLTTAIFGVLSGKPQIVSAGDGIQQNIWVQNIAFIIVPFILIAVVAAWFGMNNLDVAKASVKEQLVVFKRKHTWIISLLYLGTFGSFIGYFLAFPQLMEKVGFAKLDMLQLSLSGLILGAVSIPFGGLISDRFGGVKVTFFSYIAMVVAAISATCFFFDSNFIGAITMFFILVIAAGIGNASVFKMITDISLEERLKAVEGQGIEAEAQARRDANKEASATLGLVSAIGALCGFIILIAFGQEIGRAHV